MLLWHGQDTTQV